MERRFITKTDITAIAVLLILCLSFIILPTKKGGLKAEINADGQIQTIDLTRVTENYALTVKANGHTLTLNISRDGVEIINTDCEDKICVASGKLDRHNECAVCLPAKTVVRVYTEEKEDGVDVLL